MQGDKEIIQGLNAILKNELTAINQYFLHSRMLRDWGISELAGKEYQESIEEMQHADKLIERILFLEGLPNLQSLNKLYIGESVQEILECDLRLEHEGLTVLRETVSLCELKRDYVSRDLLMTILDNEEEHVDFLETQLNLIKSMGTENYIHLQSKPNASVAQG